MNKMSRSEYPFLESVYRDAGRNPDQERLQAYGEATELKFKVAIQIIDLLKAGKREFPILTVVDPTETVELDLQMVPFAFEAVSHKDLLRDDAKTRKGYRASVDMRSPDRDSPQKHRRVGGLKIETYPNMTDIDVVSLARDRRADEVLHTSFMNEDSQEVLGFIGMVASYLDALPE